MRIGPAGIACLALLAASSARGAPLRVETLDGAAIDFDAQGRIEAVRVGGVPMPVFGSGGFFVSEVLSSDAPLPNDGASRPGTQVAGTANVSGPNQLTVTASLPGMDASFTGVITGGAALRIDGRITNTRGGDRAFTVAFRLPVDASGWKWSSALGGTRGISASGRAYDAFNWFQGYRTTTSASPVATVADPGSGAAFALAVPPTAPSIYRVSYEPPHGFQVEWEVGTAPEPTRFPNAANVQALLYRVDASAPFRSALKRLYLLHPKLWTKRAKHGSWVYDDGSLGAVAQPEDFAIRFVETYSWADATTRAQGMYALKYVEPWNAHLERDPWGLEAWAVDSAENQSWALISKGEPRQVSAQAALLSGVIGRDGQYAGYSDPAHFTDPEGTHRYVLNPDRELPNFRGFTAQSTDMKQVLNRGRAVEEYELFRQWGAKPQSSGDAYDGLYLDSTNTTGSGWAGWHLFNFRREHFATTRVPLTFDPQSGKVALSQALSSLESVRHLAETIHERGGVVMANGMPDPFIFSTAAWCDFVSPGEHYDGNLARLRAMRAALYFKPSSYLFNYAVTEAQFQHALLYAVFPGGAGVESNRWVYKKWAPIMAEVAEAGWEPLTYARSEDPGVLVERYGRADLGTLRFVAHRESGASGVARIVLDRARLGLGAGVTLSAKDSVSGAALPIEVAETTFAVPVQLSTEQSAVIAITVTGGTALPPEGEELPVGAPGTDAGTGNPNQPGNTVGGGACGDGCFQGSGGQPGEGGPGAETPGVDGEALPPIRGKLSCQGCTSAAGVVGLAPLAALFAFTIASRRRRPLSRGAGPKDQ